MAKMASGKMSKMRQFMREEAREPIHKSLRKPGAIKGLAGAKKGCK